MKLQGIVGKGSGKYGASVWAVRRGQQVVREYVAHVENPKSEGQVRQRARFKLISQITALLSPVMVNRPIGGESVRNAFARENAPMFSWDDANSRAVVDMVNLTLTSSALGIPALSAITAASSMAVSLGGAPLDAVDAVFYAGVAKVGDKYELVSTTMVDVPGDSLHYDGTLQWPSANTTGIVYAYGVKWAGANVRTLYESYKADPVHSASLILQLMRTPSNAVFTMTRAREVTTT